MWEISAEATLGIRRSSPGLPCRNNSLKNQHSYEATNNCGIFLASLALLLGGGELRCKNFLQIVESLRLEKTLKIIKSNH